MTFFRYIRFDSCPSFLPGFFCSSLAQKKMSEGGVLDAAGGGERLVLYVHSTRLS